MAMKSIIERLKSPVSALFKSKIISKPVLILLLIASVVKLVHLNAQLRLSNNQTILKNGNKIGVTDILGLIYLPWSSDSECSDLFIQFIRNGSYPPMALATFPGNLLN